MSEQKRKRARAIIFFGDKIASVYREFEGRIFYTFPGGGMEEDESEEECVEREIFEELDLIIKPIKKVYYYENKSSIEHFYVCKWVAGEFGYGNGEEYNPNNPNGLYKPLLVKISDIPSLPLMPPEVAKVFYEDYLSQGENLCDEVKIIKGE